MELWPAIDLRGGKCVRLLQGDYDRETVFGEDPVAMARSFVAAGARRLHIVDLDGAKAGLPVQADLVRRMVEAAGVPCQLGGGVRSRDTAAAYLAAGVDRVVLGSAAVERPELLEIKAGQMPNPAVAVRGREKEALRVFEFSLTAQIRPIQQVRAEKTPGASPKPLAGAPAGGSPVAAYAGSGARP